MIRQKAFKNNQITELVIPDSVKTIEGLYTTRGYGAFQTNQLTRVTFGSGIESIGDDAFVGNKITEVDFSRSTNLREIKSFAFQNSLIMDLNLSNLTQLNKIELGAFDNNKIDTLNLPEGLQTIGNSVFTNNKLVEITIPSTVTSIGSNVFANNTTLTQINILGKTSASQFTSLGSGWNGTCNNIIYLGN